MFLLGVILLIIGLVTALKILFWVGLILLVIGAVLHFTPARSPYGRYWY